jgi:hypothetical protein
MSAATKKAPDTTVLSLGQLLEQQPATPPTSWIELGFCHRKALMFVGGEPKVDKSLLVASLALMLAAWKERAGFAAPVARRVLMRQFKLPTAQFVARPATMRRAIGSVADQNLLVDIRATAALCQSLLKLRETSKVALIVVHHVRDSVGRDEIGSAIRGSSALHACRR